MKKFLSLFLAMSLVVGSSFTVFATEGDGADNPPAPDTTVFEADISVAQDGSSTVTFDSTTGTVTINSKDGNIHKTSSSPNEDFNVIMDKLKAGGPFKLEVTVEDSGATLDDNIVFGTGCPWKYSSVKFHGTDLRLAGDTSFGGSSVTEIVLDGVSIIGHSAFNQSTNCTSISFTGLKEVGDGAFAGLAADTTNGISVTLPSGVTALNRNAFGFSYLKDFTIHGNTLVNCGSDVIMASTKLSKTKSLSVTSESDVFNEYMRSRDGGIALLDYYSDVTLNGTSITEAAGDKVSVEFITSSPQLSNFTRTINKGDKVARPENPTRDGYVFKGWFTTPDGNVEFDFNGVINENCSVYAQWKTQDEVENPDPEKPAVPTGAIEYDIGANEGEAFIYYTPSSKTAVVYGVDRSDYESGILAPGHTKRGLASEFVNTLNNQRVSGVALTTPASMEVAKAAQATTLQSIGDGLFAGNSFLRSVSLTASTLTFVGEDAFNNSSSLETINIEGNVGFDYIGENAFADSEKVKSVTVSNVKSIRDGAFSGLKNLTTLNISGVDEIGANAFRGDTSLTSVTIPEGVTVIDSNTFSGCTALETVSIPSTVKTIKAGAFANTAITEITGTLDKNIKVEAGAFTTELDEMSVRLPANAPKALMNYAWTSNGYKDLNVGDESTNLVRFVTDKGSIDPMSVATGDTIDLSQEKFQLKSSDYTFDGWFYDSAFTKAATSSPESPIVIEANTTFYAKWHKNKLTVSWDYQNGTMASTESVAYATKLKKPKDPTYGDQKFSGWFLDTTYNKPWNFNNTVEEDITLYARWTDPSVFTVSFDTDGADAIESQEVTEGQYATKPEAPKKQDFTFDDWYADAEYKTKFNFTKTKITVDTTIYAKFLSDQVVVTFDSVGGSQVTSQSVKRNSKGTAPANPTKENAEFLGWFTDSSYSKQFFFESNAVTDNMTLYAKWNQTAFTVKFVANGGSAMEPVVTEPNSLIAKPTDPVKSGYYLASWCKDSGLTTPWNFDVDQVTADMTLYAQWLPGEPEDNTFNDGATSGTKVPQTGDDNPFGWLWELFY